MICHIQTLVHVFSFVRAVTLELANPKILAHLFGAASSVLVANPDENKEIYETHLQRVVNGHCATGSVASLVVVKRRTIGSAVHPTSLEPVSTLAEDPTLNHSQNLSVFSFVIY